MLGNFLKKTLSRDIDCDSRRVIL